MRNYIEERFKNEEGEEPTLSHYRVWKNKYGVEIKVPVIDVRDGISYRVLADQLSRANHRSKWMNYNQYHTSRKKY